MNKRNLLPLVALIGAMPSAFAAVYTGLNNGSWSNTANWSDGLAPNGAITFTTQGFTTTLDGSYAITSLADSGVVNGNSAGSTMRTLTFGGTATFLNNSGGTNASLTLDSNVNIAFGSLAGLTAINVGSATKSIVINGNISLTNASSAAVNLATNTSSLGALTVNGIISGIGGVVVQSAGGTTNLNGANTYTGTTKLTAAGTLNVGSPGSININGAAGITLTNAGAILNANGKLTLTSGADTISNAGTINFAASGASIVIGNFLDGVSATGNTYRLISGGTITNWDKVSFDLGGSTQWASASLNSSGLLTFTAVPEPSAYGLIGAGALVVGVVVRRRRRRAA